MKTKTVKLVNVVLRMAVVFMLALEKTILDLNVVLAADDSTTPDVSSVIQPLNNLKTLVLTVIGAIGVIILAKNVMEFAQSYQMQDTSTMNSALKGIVAGLIMAGISTVLTFLGF